MLPSSTRWRISALYKYTKYRCILLESQHRPLPATRWPIPSRPPPLSVAVLLPLLLQNSSCKGLPLLTAHEGHIQRTSRRRCCCRFRNPAYHRRRACRSPRIGHRMGGPGRLQAAACCTPPGLVCMLLQLSRACSSISPKLWGNSDSTAVG